MMTKQQTCFSLLFLTLACSISMPWGVAKSDSIEMASRETILKPVVTEAPKSNEEDVLRADPLLAAKWGMGATDSLKAWERHKIQGSSNIVIAIIDTGIDVDHPDVRKNLWVNPGETGRDSAGRDKASNGVDDDQNGYKDDVHGWNFVDNNPSLKDNHGHGTHIAGIVGAENGNGIGIAGVAPGVKLMILKYYDPKARSQNNLVNTVKSIDYAVKMRAKIINYSGGGLEKSAIEFEAISRAQKLGILFVAAAGNERSNSDVKGYYPADYDLDNIISVTAVDKQKQVLPTSNYGMRTVDIAAPGNDIFSTLPGNKYGNMTGTSQATAYVTGVAALIMSKFTDFDARKVIKHINESGDLEPTLYGRTRYSKKLNTYRALAILDSDVSVNGAVVQNGNGLSNKDFSNDSTGNLARDLGEALKTMINAAEQPQAAQKSADQAL